MNFITKRFKTVQPSVQMAEQTSDQNSSSTVKRYAECYLDNKNEIISKFDPTLFLYQHFDKWTKSNLIICNREPYCECKSAENCVCDEDEHSIIKFSFDIGSNCTANLMIGVEDSKIKLGKEFIWRIYNLTQDKEIVLCDIDIINNVITFYTDDLTVVKFDIEDNVKIKYGQIPIRFNYMSFSSD